LVRVSGEGARFRALRGAWWCIRARARTLSIAAAAAFIPAVRSSSAAPESLAAAARILAAAAPLAPLAGRTFGVGRAIVLACIAACALTRAAALVVASASALASTSASRAAFALAAMWARLGQDEAELPAQESIPRPVPQADPRGDVAREPAALDFAQICPKRKARAYRRAYREGVDNIHAKIEEMVKTFKVHRNANDFARKFIRDA
jgi:hypothetical protein